jgi:hypothetical protein
VANLFFRVDNETGKLTMVGSNIFHVSPSDVDRWKVTRTTGPSK